MYKYSDEYYEMRQKLIKGEETFVLFDDEVDSFVNDETLSMKIEANYPLLMIKNMKKGFSLMVTTNEEKLMFYVGYELLPSSNRKGFFVNRNDVGRVDEKKENPFIKEFDVVFSVPETMSNCATMTHIYHIQQSHLSDTYAHLKKFLSKNGIVEEEEIVIPIQRVGVPYEGVSIYSFEPTFETGNLKYRKNIMPEGRFEVLFTVTPLGNNKFAPDEGNVVIEIYSLRTKKIVATLSERDCSVVTFETYDGRPKSLPLGRFLEEYVCFDELEELDNLEN